MVTALSAIPPRKLACSKCANNSRRCCRVKTRPIIRLAAVTCWASSGCRMAGGTTNSNAQGDRAQGTKISFIGSSIKPRRPGRGYKEGKRRTQCPNACGCFHCTSNKISYIVPTETCLIDCQFKRTVRCITPRADQTQSYVCGETVRPAEMCSCFVGVKSPKGENTCETKPSTPVGSLNEAETPAAKRILPCGVSPLELESSAFRLGRMSI